MHVYIYLMSISINMMSNVEFNVIYIHVCVTQESNFVPYLHSVGRPKHVRLMAGGLEGDMFIGPKAEVHV